MTWSHLLLAMLIWTAAGLVLAPIVGGAIGRSARAHLLAARAVHDLPISRRPIRDRHLVSGRAA